MNPAYRIGHRILLATVWFTVVARLIWVISRFYFENIKADLTGFFWLIVIIMTITMLYFVNRKLVYFLSHQRLTIVLFMIFSILNLLTGFISIYQAFRYY